MAQEPTVENIMMQSNIERKQSEENPDINNVEPQVIAKDQDSTGTAISDSKGNESLSEVQESNENHTPIKTDTFKSDEDDRYKNDPHQSSVQSEGINDDSSTTLDSPTVKKEKKKPKGTLACFTLDTAWETLKLTLTKGCDEVCRDISTLSPVKIQFLLQHWSKQVQDDLMTKQIKLDKDRLNWEEIYIVDTSTNRENSHDSISDAINVFEESLDQIAVRSCGVSEEKKEHMLLATISTPELVTNKVAMYNQGKKGICVVGFKDEVLKTYAVIKQLIANDSPCSRQVKISSFDGGLLSKLGFTEYIEAECNIKVKININIKTPIIFMDKATVNDVHQVVERKDTFRSSIVWTEYNIAPAKIALLRQNETKKSIEKIFDTENLLGYVDIPAESESVFIYTRTENDGKTAAMIIKTSVQKITVRSSFVRSEKFSLILEKFRGKLLLRQSENSDTCRIFCTNDALVDISMAMVNIDSSVPLTQGSVGLQSSSNKEQKETNIQSEHDVKEQNPKNGQQSRQNEYTILPGSLSSQGSRSLSSQNVYRNTFEKRRFVTQEGIDIFVYSQSILQLNVDCIVNAANERLGHGAGVDAVIARAAGYELEQEGREYIRRHGEISVGECCHTTAGNLPYKYVIHTVGPRWNNSMTLKEQKQCKKELQNAIESCLYEADTLKMRSVGVPSVSAGIFGMPAYICAVQYCEAVLNYSQQKTRSFQSPTLKEIHFIDMNFEMCKQIADVFSKCRDLTEVVGTPLGSKSSNILTSSRNSFSVSSYCHSLSNSSSSRGADEASSSLEEMVFTPCKWITIHLLQDSLTNVKDVSAVVSPENLGFKHQGMISKDILAKSDEDYIDRFDILKSKPTSIKDIYTLDCSEGMPWRYVIYVIAPHWNQEYVQKNQQFETDLKDTVVNILSEVQSKGIQSLALPLLGAAVSGMQTPMDTCCRAMLDGIWSIIKKGTRIKRWKLDLWIVTTDPTAIPTFKEMLDIKVRVQMTDDTGLYDDCCICMDKITDPKWLPCEHVFCTDCIDQQLKFKPACPQCGAVHGIITGDQPYGTMKTTINRYSLPGYDGYKTIAVTYSFPSGYQSEEHPNPGKSYAGIERTGYLPDNAKGRLVAKLLRVAFDRRLVFTIGHSVTTGKDGVITWNDIHHKTRTHGGQQSFGYPDETYLDRVQDELSAKGVTEASLNE